MEMKAKEDIAIGQDLTPPIPPTALSLHNSSLHSHCSSCFSPLNPNNPSIHHYDHFINYCSFQCSSQDFSLHFSSSEFHFFHLFPLYTTVTAFPTSTDLRLALRLLHCFQESYGSFSNLDRICGLLSNFKKIMFSNVDYQEEEELSRRILDGAKAMAVATRMRDNMEAQHGMKQELSGPDSIRKWNFGQTQPRKLAHEVTGLATNVELSDEEYAVEAAVLCLVLTNSVEVCDKEGRSIGVGVYDVAFSYINHSCSPNASYRFWTALDSGGESEFKICPAATETGIESGSTNNGREACGPRIVVRSIKNIHKGEEVLITYTDLLQPKVMRQSELWSKYRFSCCCKRCKSIPTTFIDHYLQKILCLNLDCSNMASDDNFDEDHVMEKLLDCLNDATDDFLSFSNPKSCCEKLEILLTQGCVDVVPKLNGETLHQLFRLYPLHHVSLHAYMALASAYKVWECDLPVPEPASGVDQTEAFSMCRKSAVYSLLLAGATHHLFEYESSLIVPLSNFWTTAGETLQILVRSCEWNLFSKGRQISFSSSQICDKCTLLDRLKKDASKDSHDRNAEFAEITSQFLNCASIITPRIWGFLIEGCGYLKVVEDSISFRWLESWKSSFLMNFATHAASADAKQTDSEYEAHQYHSMVRVNLFQLSIHCLLYGAFLSTICFGPHSPLMSKVKSLLSCESILND